MELRYRYDLFLGAVHAKFGPVLARYNCILLFLIIAVNEVTPDNVVKAIIIFQLERD
jgi:hypothetical protein